MQSIGVLSDKNIREEIKKGNIVYIKGSSSQSRIGNCSVDVTLGEHIYRSTGMASIGNLPGWVFNPWNDGHAHKFWNKLEVAKEADEDTSAMYGIPVATKYFILNPRENILAHTNEFIGGKKNITTMVKARSSCGRSNITVCRDAGWGDIGYINRWTLEITNNNDCPVLLIVGNRIAQIVFFYTGETENSYKGKYQEEDKIDDIINKWKPESMLPKLEKDK